MREGFRTKFKVSEKSAYWDKVTEYDLASEKFIIEKIQNKYPRHGILSEEAGVVRRHHQFWIIDPLDGTHAFSRGLAQFAVSIAFVSRNKLKLAAVYDPMADELFFAMEGKGAFLNGRKIFITRPDRLEHAVLALILGSGKTSKRQRKFFYDDLVVKHKLWNSKLETAALTLSYTACGRYDMALMKNLSPWDYAAGALILKEAGAKVTDCRGKNYAWDFEDVVAAAPNLHKELVKITSKAPLV